MTELYSQYRCVLSIWLDILVMSRTPFRVNADSIVAWISRNSLLQAHVKYEIKVTAIGLELRITWLVKESSTIRPIWPNDWAVFWVLICIVYLNVCSSHVTNAFHSESTLYSCLNVKKLHAGSLRENCSSSDCNWTRTQNNLARKLTLNNLTKLGEWLSCALITFPYGALDCMFLSYHVGVSE